MLLHSIVVPAIGWLWLLQILRVVTEKAPHETVVASTAVRIERRAVAQPREESPRPQPHAPQPVRPPTLASAASAPARDSQPAPVHAGAPQRPELSRQQPSAAPQPTAPPTPQTSPEPTVAPATAAPHPAAPSAAHAPSLAQQLAEQQRRYEQTVATLNRQNNPRSVATIAPEKPAAYRRTFFDVPGHVTREVVQAVLSPVRHWSSGLYSCYYATYYAQFAHGGSEEGTIPWPVCYPQNNDRMANPPWPHDLPIPFPPPDWVLPSGTYLSPLLREIYDARKG